MPGHMPGIDVSRWAVVVGVGGQLAGLAVDLAGCDGLGGVKEVFAVPFQVHERNHVRGDRSRVQFGIEIRNLNGYIRAGSLHGILIR